ncbi:hypothetical protein C0V78_10720 [Novosphingobium sp. TH158]|nr:hypothetical protein C0V78_10720 [Novosphingobium sp. TH158]
MRLLAVIALLIRAAVPSGWMPVAQDGGIHIAICSGSGPMEMVLSKDGTLQREGAPQVPQAPRDPCPYGVAPAMAFDVPAPVLLPPPPLVQPEAHARAQAFAARSFPRSLRPPSRGPPALA